MANHTRRTSAGRKRKGARAGTRAPGYVLSALIGSALTLAAVAWLGAPDYAALTKRMGTGASVAKIVHVPKHEPRTRVSREKPDRTIETSALPARRPARPVPDATEDGIARAAAVRPPRDIVPSVARPDRVTNLSGMVFPVCGEGPGANCVIDGDTFVVNGKAIRVADIDTPEAGDPKCRREAHLAKKATRRLQQLLNAGPLQLVAAARDEDVYGRKLRTVMRDGRSIGDTLIAEGLARRWTGANRGWCA